MSLPPRTVHPFRRISSPSNSLLRLLILLCVCTVLVVVQCVLYERAITFGASEQPISAKKLMTVKGKVFPYSLPSVGPGADPGVQAVRPQVTWSESRHRPGSRLPLLSAGPTVTPVAFTRDRRSTTVPRRQLMTVARSKSAHLTSCKVACCYW